MPSISNTGSRVLKVAEANHINFPSSNFYMTSVNTILNRVIDKWNQLPEDIVTCTAHQ